MASSKTYELMIQIAGKQDSSLKKACTAADQNFADLGAAAEKAMKVAAVAATAVAAAVVAGGKYLYDLGTEFDEAYDTIRIGTGATGEALDELTDSMKNVYATVPVEMEDAATAIADYNTRLGVTGEVLEDLSVQALQVSDLLGDDVTGVIEASSTAFQNWNIDAEDMSDAMDYIFKVSQSTGAGFTDLMSDLQTYGAQLQAVGYDFEESAVLLGQVEKAGYDTSTVMTALKTAAAAAADDGFADINEGLETYIDQIKNADSETEAYALATEVFGSKAAATMISAIDSGALSLEELQDQLTASSETIATAAEDTYSLSEKWEIFKNKMDVALEPLATTVFDAVNDAVEDLMPTVEALIPTIVEGIENIIPKLQEAASWAMENKDVIVGVAAGIATVVAAYKAYKVIKTAIKAVEAAHNVLVIASAAAAGTQAAATTAGTAATAASTAANATATISWGALGAATWAALLPIIAIVAAIAAVIAIGVLLYKNWDTICERFPALTGAITAVWDTVKSDLSTGFEFVVAIFSSVWDSIQAIWENIKGIFIGVIDFIDSVFAGDWSGAWEAIVSIFGNVFGALGNIALVPINGVIGLINGAIGAINGISIDVPDWVPGYGGKTYGFDIATIPSLTVPALASGGIATSRTFAEIGEGGEPEAVLPLSKLESLLNIDPQNPKGQGSSPITFAPVFNFYGSTPSEDEMESLADITMKKFEAMYNKMMANKSRKQFA